MRIRVSVPGLFFIAFLSAFAGATTVSEGEGRLRVLDLEGTPYQMGFIHGTALEPEITELVKRWKADLVETYRVPAEKYIQNFLSHTDFLPAIERWTPGLLDEVRGIAAGAAGLALIYTVMGFCYQAQVTGLPMLLLVLAAIGCYAMSLAPITWVVISEIFPNRIRGAATSVAVSSLWAACFILTYTFPILNKSFGPAGTFWLYGAICVAGFVFIRAKLPETKGKTLEQIERELVG